MKDKEIKETSDIPRWSFITGQFLCFAEKQLEENDQRMTGIFDEFLKQYEYEEYKGRFHLGNQGVILMLMYALLVIPRELLREEGKIFESFKFNTKEHFNIKIPDRGDISNIDFLRFLRNAVSHANIEILTGENGVFKFWNIPPNTSKRNFEVEIDKQGLLAFLTEFGKFYVNKVMPDLSCWSEEK